MSGTVDYLCVVLLLGDKEGISQYALDGRPNYFPQR